MIIPDAHAVPPRTARHFPGSIECLTRQNATLREQAKTARADVLKEVIEHFEAFDIDNALWLAADELRRMAAAPEEKVDER